MKKFLPIIFLFFSSLLSNKSFACNHSEISLVSKTINGDGTVTYELDIKIEIGSGDGAYYGFALEFLSTGALPNVTSFPSEIQQSDLTSGSLGYNLQGRTGNAVNSIALDSDWIKYKKTNAITYESYNSAASSTFTFRLKYTLSKCSEEVRLDAHVNFDAPACMYTLSTGSCITCPVTIKPVAPDVCQGATTNLTSGVSGTQGANPKFSWTTASGLTINNDTASDASINIPKAQSSGDYIVKLNYKDDGGCDVTEADTFKVKASPTISGVLSICVGATSQLIGSGTPASNAWSSSLSNVTVNNTGLVTGVNAGKSIITYKDNSGCSKSDTVVVGTSDTASVSIAASSVIVCPNDTIIFTATPVHGGNKPSYQWKVNGLPVGTDSAIFKSSTLNSGDYVKVVMTSSDTCVIGSPANSFQITLNSTGGNVAVTASKDSICAGDTVTFTAIPDDTSAVTGYQWKKNGINVGTNSAIFTTSSLAHGDTITVVVSVTSSCGTSSIEGNKIRIVVNSSPNISVSLVNISCNGFNDGSALIGANGGKPNYLYSKDGIVFQPQNSFDNLQAASYSFTVKDQNGCKGKIDTAISAPPPITFIVNPVSAIICFGDSVQITATGYSSFNWFNQTAGIKVDTNKTSIKVAPTTNSVYKVVSTICGVSDSVDITVLAPVLIDPIADKTICLGDTAFFKANASGGKGTFTYTWTPVPDFINLAGDSAYVKPISLAPITYLLKAKNDCPGYLLSFKVKIDPLPLVEIHSLVEVCVGEKIDFINTSHASNYYTYAWNFNDGNTSSDTASASNRYQSPGNYKVYLIVTDSNNCKNNDTSDVILVNSTPKGVISNFPNDDLNTNSVVMFTAVNSLGVIKKYQWSFDNNSLSENVDTSLIFRDAGNHLVQLIVSNDKCLDTVFKTIKIVNDFALFIPSTFSPNDDGNNDIFVPKGFGIIDFNMQLWNEWGELVFETDDFNKGWDGLSQAKSVMAPNGVYVYKMKYNAIGRENEKFLEKNGHVSLVR